MNPPDIYWTGASGKKYGYWIHPVNARFRKIAGNVVFAKKNRRRRMGAALHRTD